MWRATIKSLLAHKVRLGLTALAVVLGVAFVAGTYMLTDTIDRSFDGLFDQIEHGVAVDVSGVPQFTATGPGGQTAGSPERVPASLLQSIRGVNGVRDAEGSISGYAQLVDKQGKAITTGGAPTVGFNWITDPDLASVDLRQGRPPKASGEVAIDAGTARTYGFHVGDRTRVLLQGPAMPAAVVGIFGFGQTDNLLGATVVAFDQQTAERVLNGNGQYDDILVAADRGVSPTDLRNRIQQVLPKGFQAQTGQQAAAASSADLKKSLSFINIALLVFAGIALFVGAFIIFNTFAILIAQRTRELALLRALGASPAQVRRSVLVEAAIVGVVASLAGLAAGFGMAIGLRGLFKLIGADLPSTTIQVLPRTIVVALVVGIVTTVASSILPAFRASRVPPMAALREAEPAAWRPSRRRTLIGGSLTAAGIGVLLLGLFGGTSKAAALVGLGAALVFFGVTVLSPLVARPIARVLGAPLGRLSGISGRLGRDNAMRNPRRTSSTAAALMIGLALVGFVSIFAASIKASTNAILEQTLKADYIVSTTQFTGFSQDVAKQLEADPAFGAVEEFRFGTFGYKGAATTLNAVDPAQLNDVTQVTMQAGSVSNLADGDVLVWKNTAESNAWTVGDTIPVQFARTGNETLRIVGIYTDNRLLGNYVVSLGTYEANFTDQLDGFVLAKTAPGVSLASAKAAAQRVARRFPNVRLQDQAQFRESQAAQIDKALAFFLVLLMLAIIIAVVGIINTLYLSIYERTREIGLLRAVGLSRRQTRTMVRWEAVITAVFGALLGTAIGVFFGWAMIRALHGQGVTVFSIPSGQLALYVLLAGLAGVVAAVFPARKAAKLDILQAIASE